NVFGGVGAQKNDSILLDFGMEPRKYNGKYIQPLVAITVLDHDGKGNLAAIGNNLGQPNASTWGMGPSEIALRRLLEPNSSIPSQFPNADTDAQKLVNGRYTGGALATRGGVNSLYFDRSGVRLPSASQAAW